MNSVARRPRGFTLVELMIAMLLGLMITAAVISLFIQTRTNNRQNDNIARMQENARFAIQVLRDDLAHADFFGPVTDPAAITVLATTPIGSDCAGAANFATYTLSPLPSRLSYLADLSATQANTNFNCIDAGSFRAGGNVLALKRIIRQPATLLVNNTLYVDTNGEEANLYHRNAAGQTNSAITGGTNWEYTVRIYYIDTNSSLARETLRMGAAPAMAADTLVDDIEHFHIEFGIDNTADGIPDLYTPTPDINPAATVIDIENAATARIFVLARSPEAELAYTNTKTYTMGTEVRGPYNDHFYRRVYSTTVGLKNLVNRRLLQQGS